MLAENEVTVNFRSDSRLSFTVSPAHGDGRPRTQTATYRRRGNQLLVTFDNGAPSETFEMVGDELLMVAAATRAAGNKAKAFSWFRRLNTEEKPIPSGGNFPPKPLTQSEVITLPPNAGPAAKVVQSFFTNWKSQKYELMHAQLRHDATTDEFASALKSTPVTWKVVKIVREVADGDASYVEFAAEVTDLPSVMGAWLFSQRPDYPFRREASRENPIPARPANLQIETYTTVNQVWRVVPVDGTMKIDVAQEDKDSKCRDKLIEYVLDASRRTFVSDKYGSDMFRLNMARIIVQLSDSLGMSGDEAQSLIPEMTKKAEQAKEFFDRVLHNVGEAIGEK